MQHFLKRYVAWALLLSGHSVWSFRIMGKIAFDRSIRRGVLPRTTSGNMIRMGKLDRIPTPAQAGKCDIIACATKPFLGLRPVVTGFLAAMCVLAAEPSVALSADVNPSARTPAAASTTTERQGNALPSTMLEGELGAQFQKAQAAGSVQQFDKAKKLYDQVVKYAPGYVYGWSNRANVLIAEGDLRGAISDYDRALELADSLNMPDKWIIYLNRGTTFLALGDNDRALADLDRAAVLNKQKDLYILANRAQAHERKEDWASALRDYEGAISAQPGNVQPWWIRYSLVLFQQERDFDSLAFLRRLQSKFEGVGEIQAAVTAVEFGRGDFAAAERAWMGINPVDRQMYLNGSYLQDQLKWPPRIIESLRAFDREQKELDARPLETSNLATLS